MPPVQTAQFNREDVTIHLMDIHIDLSNRLEESGPTFIAFSNHLTYVIKIPTKVKRWGMSLLQLQRTPQKQIKPLLWTACLFLLLKPHLARIAKETDKIAIDNEFDGYQALIKAALLRHIWQRCDKFPQHKIVITSIGKKSLVHHTVLQAKRGRRRIDKVIRKQEMSEVL